ncbi:MAG TPA: type III pantothenate kinase [Flavobacterium sp.]|uniref:type III pantothenate kinase n=1 Tax=unclassified Flavobacterium TaxID=196869 RepID=UPI0025BBD583|nr:MULTISPECIES: type III pantothenate kinase [unclassified Flavobacterium]HRE77479.1 type III pantothenate kinase [Flavobacterium sp.]
MVLVVDIGNTRIKCAVYELNTLMESYVFTDEVAENNFKNIFFSYPKITDLIISSVAKDLNFDLQTLSNTLNVHFVSNLDSFPFQNKYVTPKTLGVDRMILAAGATLLYPNQNRLIIDAGTCITYDFVDENDNYWGGAISPGFRLRYESLHQFTAKLPLLTLEEPIDLVGNSTNQSIHSGVVNGLICEMDGFIDRYKQQYENFTIILTGGDTVFLAKRLKNTIFANSNFLLDSLNKFFQYKIKND